MSEIYGYGPDWYRHHPDTYFRVLVTVKTANIVKYCDVDPIVPVIKTVVAGQELIVSRVHYGGLYEGRGPRYNEMWYYVHQVDGEELFPEARGTRVYILSRQTTDLIRLNT